MYRIYISFPISGYDLEERKQYAIQKEAELIDDFYNQRVVWLSLRWQESMVRK